MADHERASGAPGVEDQMIRDWASSGIRRLEHHLLVQARFAAYLRSIERRAPPDPDAADDEGS